MSKFIDWFRDLFCASEAAVVPSANDEVRTATKPIDDSLQKITRQRLGGQDALAGLDFRNRYLKDVNGANATFDGCDFSYSIFDRAYFHNATFKNCKFTGCRFYDSNLRMASLYSCDIRYCLFSKTLIENDELIASLPLEPNLRRDLLQNLRANAAEVGDAVGQRVFILQEIAAKADHLNRAIRGSDSYYREKFSRIRDKVRAAFKLLWLHIGGFVWGHGENAGRIFVSALSWIAALSLINFWAVLPRVPWHETFYGVNIFRYCFDLFIDFNPDQKFKGFIAIDYILMFMRYIYIGLFVSVLYKGISHR